MAIESLSSEKDSNPPEMVPSQSAIDIGPGHRIEFVTYEGETAGINEWHLKSDGKWCKGWVAFNGSKWLEGFSAAQGWDVQQREPLTLSPSIACRVCGSHGHIRNGRWEVA